MTLIPQHREHLADACKRHAKPPVGLPGLLERLEYVRATGPGRYRAQCPAHGGDNHGTLSIKQGDDGTILLRCHAHECPAAEIMAAVGLEVGDLFPARLTHHAAPQERLRWKHDAQHRDWRDALNTALHEIRIVWVASKQIAADQSLNEIDQQRLDQATATLERIGRHFRAQLQTTTRR